MILLRKSQHFHPQQRPAAKIKWHFCFFLRQTSGYRFPGFRWEFGQVLHEHGDRMSRSNDLYWLALLYAEGSAQYFMSGDELCEYPLQQVNSHRPSDPQGQRDVVRGRSRLQLIEKPQPLLREGQRDCLVARDWHNRRNFFYISRCSQWLDDMRQLRYGRRFEQLSHGQIHVQSVANARHYLRCQQ